MPPSFFVARCFLPGELLEEGSTSSTTGVSDDLASVEREERSVRLGAGSVIKTSSRCCRREKQEETSQGAKKKERHSHKKSLQPFTSSLTRLSLFSRPKSEPR